MSVLDELSRLSAAEEFFTYLDVGYDPALVNVARLHILRRMGQYLRESQTREAFARMDDAQIRLLCRDHLAKAYQDFVISSPIKERLFKVHQDAVALKPEPALAFVPLSALTGGV
ncbi:nitrogenase stabilizing/protective protein NifW [Acidocella sp.]|uniref:nitrogenase stabilizing/protective protein NifW n=1 Tax=Acidocella sp. TaxID=50710 RepID=UPI0026019394|nr:nitrogenase stabilizing/protective protein NifW [Acidocella sp.]